MRWAILITVKQLTPVRGREQCSEPLARRKFVTRFIIKGFLIAFPRTILES